MTDKLPASIALVDSLTGHGYCLTRQITSIGRSPSSDLRLDDRSISRQHAAIYYLRDTFYLEDFDSLNGTSVNGVPVKGRRVVINSGDEIRVGLTCLRFIVSQGYMPANLLGDMSDTSVPHDEESSQATTLKLPPQVFTANHVTAVSPRAIYPESQSA